MYFSFLLLISKPKYFFFIYYCFYLHDLYTFLLILEYIHIIITKIKTSILKSSLCGYSDAYIIVNGTIKITGAGADANGKREDENKNSNI